MAATKLSSPESVAAFLSRFNRWRRGQGEFEDGAVAMPEPAEIGKAIDEAVKMLAEPKAAREPVAWMYDWHAPEGLIRDWATSNRAEIPKHAINIRPLYARPVPDEPVNARLLELAKWAASCLDFDEEWMPEAAEKLRRTRAAIAAAEAQQAGPVRLTSEVIAECLKQWRSSRHETYENLAWIVEAASLRANGFKVKG